MQDKTHSKDSCFRKEKQDHIGNNSPRFMQWMKPNAATIWIENRMCQQVI